MAARSHKDPFIVSGYYRHYKGGIVYVLGVAVSSERRNSWQVVYYSFRSSSWIRRPLHDRRATGKEEKCGWLDPVQKDHYQGPRYTIFASTLPLTPTLPDFSNEVADRREDICPLPDLPPVCKGA